MRTNPNRALAIGLVCTICMACDRTDRGVNIPTDSRNPVIHDSNRLFRVTPEDYDFEQILLPSSSIDASIKIENLGVQSLRLTKVLSSCGCTVVSAPNKVLSPGEATEVAVSLRPDEIGLHRSHVRVFGSLDNNPPTLLAVVQLKWNAIPKIVVEPAQLDFGALQVNRPKTKEIRIAKNGSENQTPSITKFTTTPEGSLTLSEDEGVLFVTPSKCDTVGDWRASLHIAIDSEGGRITIPVRWSIVDRIQVVPAKRYVGLRALNEPVAETFLIRSDEEILSVERNSPGNGEVTFESLDNKTWRCTWRTIAPETIGIFSQSCELRTKLQSGDSLISCFSIYGNAGNNHSFTTTTNSQ